MTIVDNLVLDRAYTIDMAFSRIALYVTPRLGKPEQFALHMCELAGRAMDPVTSRLWLPLNTMVGLLDDRRCKEIETTARFRKLIAASRPACRSA